MSTDPGTLLNVSYIIYLPVTLYRSILNICIHLCYIPNCNFSGFFPFFFFFFQNVNATRKNSVALMKFKISFCFFLLCVCVYTLIDTYVLVEILKISAFAEYSLQFTATIMLFFSISPLSLEKIYRGE